ncbi:hypothetical protein RchiOBHm_Chr4g0392281 [Rosa chinensis]|uniref:Uncharacterized protein n=1 Tax=Rosa chinensis TaxID=74649 RepID=A0A2P6QQQ3_ROSCH|nr:hypothetical protein RchiOBHm_Chr4g0392281 [Rosa chinensis]
MWQMESRLSLFVPIVIRGLGSMSPLIFESFINQGLRAAAPALYSKKKKIHIYALYDLIKIKKLCT